MVFFTKVQKSSRRFFLKYDTGSILTLTVGVKRDWGQKISPKKKKVNEIEYMGKKKINGQFIFGRIKK